MVAVLTVTVNGCGAAPGPGAGPGGTLSEPSGSSASSASSLPAALTITVAGRRIIAAGVYDVADAIRVAGVVLPDGRLLSVVARRVLDAHARPAGIRVNGTAASLTTAVAAGDVITFVPGVDSVEATRIRQVPVSLDPAAAALYVSYAPGRSQVVQGVLSGEQVSSVLLSAPTVGRLRSPAWLSFTFDDGPDQLATPQVMALLAAHHTPAVFCLIGVNALAHPGLARAEASGGYRMCDHTQTHPLNLPELPLAQLQAQIRTRSLSVSQADGGVAPVYFRAPGGNWSVAVEAVARSLHLIPLSWTVDPRDWSKPGTEQIISSVLNQLRPNGIILMHDGGGNRTQTVAALTRLLPELAAAGWNAKYPS